jgi:hypothetical protein
MPGAIIFFFVFLCYRKIGRKKCLFGLVTLNNKEKPLVSSMMTERRYNMNTVCYSSKKKKKEEKFRRFPPPPFIMIMVFKL